MSVRILALLATLFALVVFGAIFVRSCCCTFVDNYEMGYRYDMTNGQITPYTTTGYKFYKPFVTEVHTVDLRPMQVCINANSRVLNCKLVQFDPAGLELFLSWHGRANYESTPPTGGGVSTLNGILMSYAYDGSGKNYPFLKVIRELKPEDATTAPVSP